MFTVLGLIAGVLAAVLTNAIVPEEFPSGIAFMALGALIGIVLDCLVLVLASRRPQA